MIIYANSRQSGKTTKAIKLAAATHSVLIVSDRGMVHFVEKEAVKMNYPVRVISAKDFFDPRNRYRREEERIVIDELDSVLSSIFGCKVIMATTTGCITNIDIE